LRANTGRAAYGASKAGLELLSKVMAVELAPLGVRVNTVAPGPIETPLVTAMHSPADRARAVRSVPQGRYGQPQDIAKAVSYLLDDERSGYVTGHTLCVDGGFFAAGAFDRP
jgi:NAD(P)-dependent dehydrogenase (short-subunit alcohol dehydrogenase family)